ncbi:MAG: hypothetical protein AB1758_25915 [Candidatus Eremiobacterota bacterium]
MQLFVSQGDQGYSVQLYYRQGEQAVLKSEGLQLEVAGDDKNRELDAYCPELKSGEFLQGAKDPRIATLRGNKGGDFEAELGDRQYLSVEDGKSQIYTWSPDHRVPGDPRPHPERAVATAHVIHEGQEEMILLHIPTGAGLTINDAPLDLAQIAEAQRKRESTSPGAPFQGYIIAT